MEESVSLGWVWQHKRGGRSLPCSQQSTYSLHSAHAPACGFAGLIACVRLRCAKPAAAHLSPGPSRGSVRQSYATLGAHVCTRWRLWIQTTWWWCRWGTKRRGWPAWPRSRPRPKCRACRGHSSRLRRGQRGRLALRVGRGGGAGVGAGGRMQARGLHRFGSLLPGVRPAHVMPEHMHAARLSAHIGLTQASSSHDVATSLCLGATRGVCMIQKLARLAVYA